MSNTYYKSSSNSNINNIDIYEQKILPNNYTYHPYITFKNTNITNMKNFLQSRDLLHRLDMYNVKNENLNFVYTKYQRELILHNSNTNDKVFNSCIYTPNYKGELGCLESNKDLNKDYFVNNQKYNNNILTYLDKDIQLLNNNLF